jgi:hypothetical protein
MVAGANEDDDMEVQDEEADSCDVQSMLEC